MAAETDTIIAVDLDGTLTLTDTLHESVVLLLRERPLQVLALPFWFMTGKAALKAKLADRVTVKAKLLPYNIMLIEWLRKQKATGRKLVLCTAADQHTAQSVADHLQFFDYVFASDGKLNLAGENKRQVLEEHFGKRGYDYVGNDGKDVAVWAGARQAIVVNASARVRAAAKRVAEVEQTFDGQPIPVSAWCRVFRVHQYLKNLLLFVPLLAAHQISHFQALWLLWLAFVSFSLCASSVYITNDLFDLDSDRQHPRKRYRPFAAGTVPISYGAVLVPICAAISVALALMVGTAFTAWLIVYFAVTFTYSLRLKRYALIDCLTLAGLYTMRIAAGAAAAAILLSFWLLAFSIFIFLSLAFVKRYAELQVQRAHGKTEAHGRGYVVGDAPLVQTQGIAAGYAAVLVLALYIQGETVVQLYRTPELIWLAIPLILYWISWVWLQTHRGEMHEDPIVFAVRDRTSWVVAAGIAAVFVVAAVV